MGRKAGLSLDEIVDAAASLADRDGLSATTLEAVARRLGIKSPSLHYRVNGASGLRRLLALRANQQIHTALEQAAEAADPVRAMCHAYRHFATAHPGLYDATLPAPRPGEDDELYEAGLASVRVVADALADRGVPDDQLIHAVRAIRAALHGFVDNERRGGFGMPEDIEESFTVLLDLLLGPADGAQ